MHMIDLFYMYMLHILYTWDKEKSDGKTDCDSWEIFKGVLRWHFWGDVWTDSIKCIDDLQKNGGLSQSQENNKLTNLKARVSSLSFRISMKTWMARLAWTSGRVSTSHLFYWNLPKSVPMFYFTLILK